MVSGAQAAQPQPPMVRQQQREMLAKNAERLAKIANRIRAIARAGTAALPSVELINLIYALARGIDYAVSAGDVPTIAADVPNILRMVYELRKEPSVQSSVMVLAISCKNACSNKWFRPTDSTDILRLANELLGNFCTSPGEATNDITVIEIISKIMPRYYPQLKFNRLVTSMEAKVGYDVLMADFFIERNLPIEEKIRLIVVQKDNLDASSCITSPPHVSFLVNGKGVDMRTNVAMETGPQFPTDITKMLKFGANIIQAVGYFDANYIISVAFMKSLTSFSAATLDDYAQPVTADPADSDVLEGPSRVSLKCPISMTRIKTPIKGHLCKHYQCFDYDNYIKINLIKPTWSCPYCKTPSNFLELRIDQKITKILQETGDDVLDVLLFADGSWKAAQAHNETDDKHTKTRDTITYSSSSAHFIDLVNVNGDDLPTSGLKDTKPVLCSQDLSMLDLPISRPAQAGQMSSNIVSTSQNVLHAIVTDAVCPLGTSNSTSEMIHMQPEIDPQHGSEVSRPRPRNPGSEAGLQELPVPPQNTGSSRRLQPNTLHCAQPVANPTSSTYQAHQVTNSGSVIAPINNYGGTLPRAPSAVPLFHQQSTTQDMCNASSHLTSRVVGLHAPHMMGSRQSAEVPSQTGGANAYLSMHVLNELMVHNPLNQTAQAARSNTSSAAEVGPTQMDIQSHLFSRQQSHVSRPPLNQTAQAARSNTSSAAEVGPTQMDIQSHLFSRQQSHVSRPQTVPQTGSSEAVLRAASQQQSPGESTVAQRTSQAGASDSTSELPVDENWRPSGRMRGSLTGNAYNHAIDRYLGQAAQPESRARPASASNGKRAK